MDTGIFAAFSKKVISAVIAVGSMFYSTIDGVTPNMTLPGISYKNDFVFISTTIENCYTEDLEQIFHSGNSIPIYYSIELYREGIKEPDSVNTFYHTIQYSPIGNDFSIYFSERDEILRSLSLNQAKELLPSINNYRVTSAEDIDSNSNYYIKVTAWLDKISVEGMEEKLNLTYYWNSLNPDCISEIFSKSDFQI